MLNRREFLKTVLGSAAAIPFLRLPAPGKNVVEAPRLPSLPDEPVVLDDFARSESGLNSYQIPVVVFIDGERVEKLVACEISLRENHPHIEFLGPYPVIGPTSAVVDLEVFDDIAFSTIDGRVSLCVENSRDNTTWTQDMAIDYVSSRDVGNGKYKTNIRLIGDCPKTRNNVRFYY